MVTLNDGAIDKDPHYPSADRETSRQVGMQALMMRSEWFAVGRKGAEGPREEHFLWLLCKKNWEDVGGCWLAPPGPDARFSHENML